jgi:hypothetical protein
MRDPENELYDRACDLVEAAAAPALLGCLQAGLADLRLMSAGLLSSLDLGAGPGHDRLRQSLASLAAALRDAEAAADAARTHVVGATAPSPWGRHRRRMQPGTDGRSAAGRPRWRT